MNFNISSSDQKLLHKAMRIAENYAKTKIAENIVGIVFLGGIARGYFDKDADIDIAIFKNENIPEVEIHYETIEGIEIQTFVAGYHNEQDVKWEMNKRWAYSNVIIYYDTENKILDLLHLKVPMLKKERTWIMISGITLSEWYCNRLLDLWISRNSILNAHYMINEGINQYLNALFALNNELVADHKWKIYCALQLHEKPEIFESKLSELMQMNGNTIDDVERRRLVFLDIWKNTLTKIEKEVGMKYTEFKNLV